MSSRPEGSAAKRWELSILVGPCERDDAEDLLVDVLDFIREEILPVATVDFGPVGALTAWKERPHV